MPDPFESCKALVRRANGHIDSFEYKWSQYAGPNHYTHAREIDPLSGEQILKVRVHPGFPIELACILFDAVNGLRSALDHAVYGATIVLTGRPDPSRTKFPFGRTYDIAEKELERAVDVPASIRDFLLDFGPYESGDKTLFGLNEVRNRKIHRILAPMAHATGALSIGGNGRVGRITRLNEWDAGKGELTYARGVDIDPGVKIDVSVAITFTEDSPFPNGPVVPILREASGRIVGIVSAIEAETARIVATHTT